MTGTSPWPLWPIHLVWAICLALVTGAGALWSVTTRLDSALTLPARFATAAMPRQIQHPQGGRVSEILVAEGENVTAGTPLLRLSDDTITGEAALVAAEREGIRLRRLRLLAQSGGTPPDFGPLPPADPAIAVELALYTTAEEDRRLAATRLTQDMARLAARIAALERQTAALARQIHLREEDLATQTALAGAGLAQRNAARQSATALAALEAEAAALDAALSAARADRDALPLDSARQEARRRHETAAELQSLAARDTALALRATHLATQAEALVLRAPIAGTVQGLRSDATTLGAGEVALHLVPAGAPQRVEADLPAAQIARVSLGQPARLRVSADPLRDMPPLLGHVAAIAPYPHRDPLTGAQMFRLTVALDTVPPTIRAGQEGELSLLTGAATPLAYLLAPLTGYFATAFGES